MTAIGRLMKKHHSHDACWTRRPATTGPAATETAAAPPHIPTARLSLSFGKAARMIASVLGINIAPNTPRTARKAITPPIEPTLPTASELKPNPVTPIRKMSLRPKRSPNLPIGTSSTARESR